jgi:hypothetical protein
MPVRRLGEKPWFPLRLAPCSRRLICHAPETQDEVEREPKHTTSNHPVSAADLERPAGHCSVLRLSATGRSETRRPYRRCDRSTSMSGPCPADQVGRPPPSPCRPVGKVGAAHVGRDRACSVKPRPRRTEIDGSAAPSFETSRISRATWRRRRQGGAGGTWLAKGPEGPIFDPRGALAVPPNIL